jgi:uncharacterized protein (DUF2461 family)
VGLWIAQNREESSSGDEGISARDLEVFELLVCTRTGTWQPASSLHEYMQQYVVEICATWVAKESAARRNWE